MQFIRTVSSTRRAALTALAVVLAACSSQVGTADGGADAVGSDIVAPNDAIVGRTPMNHRAATTTCDRPPPPLQDSGTGPVDAGPNNQCVTSADCTAQPGGHCGSSRIGMTCSYDGCYADTDCAGMGMGGACTCGGSAFSNGAANACHPGNCRVDGDCGANGFCSPTFDTQCGPYSGFQGFYCHTPTDECLDDGDCMSPTMGLGYCAYSQAASRWVCGYSRCAG